MVSLSALPIDRCRYCSAVKPYMLRPGTHLTQVYLYRGFVDFNKGHKCLSALIEHEFGHDVFTGTLYVFGNRQRTRIIFLFWEDNGFVLHYKALAKDKFHWPHTEQELLRLTGEQLNWLLDGFNLGLMKPHKTLHYESIT